MGVLQVEVAGDAHIAEFLGKWRKFYVAKKLTEPDWSYRLFRWELIIAAPNYLTAAAVDGTQCEGLLAMHRKGDTLKIDFLATAPWNHGPNKILSGVGTGLLANAVRIAADGSFPGGAILSSTPESESFYENRGWSRTGDRDHEDLAVFHLAAERLAPFLAKHQPLPVRQ